MNRRKTILKKKLRQKKSDPEEPERSQSAAPGGGLPETAEETRVTGVAAGSEPVAAGGGNACETEPVEPCVPAVETKPGSPEARPATRPKPSLTGIAIASLLGLRLDPMGAFP